MNFPGPPLRSRFAVAYLSLAATALACLLGVGAAAGVVLGPSPSSRPIPRPVIERTGCDGEPHRTKTFDRSQAGNVLYMFIYDDVFREDLGRGYRLASKELRTGGAGRGSRAALTKRDWIAGNIPVPFLSIVTGVACTVGARHERGRWAAVVLIDRTMYLTETIREDGRWRVDSFRALRKP